MEAVPTEDRIVFADGAFTMDEIYATMSPTRLRAEFYYKQIWPVRQEHTTQMLSAQLSGLKEFGLAANPTAIAVAKRATLEFLEQKVEAGEVDVEMAEIAKEEFGLIRAVR